MTIPTTDSDTAPARKFMFDRSFDAAAAAQRVVERKPVLMKPEQIDRLKQEAYDEGFASGKTAGSNEQTAQLAKLMLTIDHNVTGLMQNLAKIAQEQDAHTRQLVLAVAKKILPEFTARYGMGEIEALLSETIREMAREPRLVVRVHEEQFDAVNERVQAIATDRAYAGKVIVLADAEVAAGDCRVEWADGGIERNTQATWNAVERTIHPTT